MTEIVGIRFKKAGKIYFFDPDGIMLSSGSSAIVETVRGIEFGSVVKGNTFVSEDEITQPLKRVVREATPEDFVKQKRNKEREKEAFSICEEKIFSHGLNMKLIDVEETFDNNKLIFYFTSDARVDFRELVKELAAVFRTRIELRQIGVRDEAKMLNGIGMCGRTLCCATFLADFQPVSIKMAKEQSLSLNPTKISGICGRLMCCLKYEEDVYEHLSGILPNVSDIVLTPCGRGEVISVSTLKQQVRVAVKKKSEDAPELLMFDASELKILERRKVKRDEDFEDLTAYE